LTQEFEDSFNSRAFGSLEIFFPNEENNISISSGGLLVG